MKLVKGNPCFTIKEVARELNVRLEKLLDCLFEGGGPIHFFTRDELYYRVADVDYFRIYGGPGLQKLRTQEVRTSGT